MYFPPEMYLNIHEYPKSHDLWTIGLVFFEMVTHKSFITCNTYTDDELFYTF
jgi:serine/threonine protein kinase